MLNIELETKQAICSRQALTIVFVLRSGLLLSRLPIFFLYLLGLHGSYLMS